MKFIHISDLHIGKRIYERSLIEDQKHILDEILGVIGDEKPDAVFIAGDIYDKAVPSAEAVAVFDDFLCRLSGMHTETFVISGNHDSPERIAFGSALIDPTGIHLSPVFSGAPAPYPVKDRFGEVDIYMLPFVRTPDVRAAFPDEELNSLEDALRVVFDHIEKTPGRRSVLVAHQFVSGAGTAGSETSVFVGGSDMVGTDVFGRFDYIALGHIHKPQNVTDRIRYCGTPLKYDFSEANDEKSVTVGEMDADGKVTLHTVPLTPLHDMKCVTGSFDEVCGLPPCDDYIRVTLTDNDPVIDAAGRLRPMFKGLLEIRYDNERTRLDETISQTEDSQRDYIDIFAELYEKQNGVPLDDEKREIMLGVIDEVLSEVNME